MAYTEVQIANLALARIGHSQRITALASETTPAARACNLFYEPMRDSVLRDFAWPFASKIEALALVEQDPNDDWGYSYRYPTDCIRALRMVTGDRGPVGRPPFEVSSDDSGLVIYTDQADAVLKYTWRIEDPALFAPDFAEALAWRLAAEIVVPLSLNDSLEQRARVAYARSVLRAQAMALEEGQPDTDLDSEFIRARE